MMVNTWSLLIGRKHDILAGTFALVSMIFVLQILAGRSGSAVDQVIVAKAGPPSLGTIVDKADAPDALARAGETTESKQEVTEGTETEPQPTEPDDSQDQEQPPTDVSEMEDNAQNADLEDINVATNSDLAAHDTTEAKHLVSSTTLHEAQQTSTPVEEAPKPVEQMSAAELQEAVEAYEKWVHEGQIRLILDYSQLNIGQLDSITLLYVARTMHTAILVSPDGKVRTLRASELPTGKLIGDLPTDRSKWPPVLATRARERFGSGFMAEANFMLTDACAVWLYRTLAQALGNKEPRPDMEFVLRLQPNGQQLEVQLVRQR